MAASFPVVVGWWELTSSESPSPSTGQDTDSMRILRWYTSGQGLLPSLGPGPAIAGPQQKTLGPWMQNHTSSSTAVWKEDPRWLMGTLLGSPSIHGSSWATERALDGAVSAPGPVALLPTWPVLPASFAGQGATWTQACAVWPASGSSVWCPCHWLMAR